MPAAVPHALPKGTAIDHYVIEDVIGAGGFGITYRARHAALGKLFAIKEHFPSTHAYRDPASLAVLPTTANDPMFTWARDRFLEEARTLARFRHRAIVAVASVFEANGTAYSVLEHEQGRTLATFIERLRRRPSQVELDHILPPLLEALAMIHAANYLHRDISPDNIMLRPDGSACLLDFGSARQAMGRRALTLTAVVKSGYSPPEQYLSEGRGQGPWTDIYALAATLYRTVTGEVLPEATERMLRPDAAPVARAAAGPGYRASFLAAIDWGLALKPDERPQSVAHWAQPLFAADATTLAGGASSDRAHLASAPYVATEVPLLPPDGGAAAPDHDVPPALLLDPEEELATLAERVALLLAAVALPAVLAAAYLFHTLRWGVFLTGAQTGLLVGALGFLGAATSLLIHREAQVSPRELALYWLTLAILSGLVLGLLFALLGMSAFDMSDPLQGQLLTGWLAGLALVVLSSFGLMARRGPSLAVGEHVIYAVGWLIAAGWVTAFALHAMRKPANADMVTLLALGLLAGLLFAGVLFTLTRAVRLLAVRLQRAYP